MRRSGADVPTTAHMGTIIGAVNSVHDTAELLCTPAPTWAGTFGPLAAPVAGRAPVRKAH